MHGDSIKEKTGSGSSYFRLRVFTAGTQVNYRGKPQLIDLKVFPLTSAEMADFATAKAALKQKGVDIDKYIPFNEGTLTDSKPTKLISYGYNLCDEEIEGGTYNGSTGEKINHPTFQANNCRTANKFRCFGGVSSTAMWASSLGVNTFGAFFWDKDDNYIGYINQNVSTNTYTFMPPSNCAKVSFGFFKSGSGWQANPPTKAEAQLCFHLASVNLGYKPHVPAIEYDLTMPRLKSAGSVQDESKVGGEKTGSFTFAGNEAWSYYDDSTNPFWYLTDEFIHGQDFGDETLASNGIKVRFAGGSGTVLRVIISDNPQLSSSSDMNAIFASGTKINFKLKTPTDFSDPISYPEIIEVDAGGLVDVVGDGCDATTKVYFYVEA